MTVKSFLDDWLVPLAMFVALVAFVVVTTYDMFRTVICPVCLHSVPGYRVVERFNVCEGCWSRAMGRMLREDRQ